MATKFVFHFHFPPADSSALVLERLTSIMTAIQDLAPQIEALTTQVTKIGTEIGGLKQSVADLEAALAAAGSVPQDVLDKFDALKASVQAVDDLVPDVPTP